MQTIVIAWAENTKLVPTGRQIMRDLNYFPEFKTAPEGYACIWLNKGNEKDLQKARDYAANEGRMVYTFPCGEKDPLGKARDLVVKQSKF